MVDPLFRLAQLDGPLLARLKTFGDPSRGTDCWCRPVRQNTRAIPGQGRAGRAHPGWLRRDLPADHGDRRRAPTTPGRTPGARGAVASS
jgi:hypothetical protein